jgi:hypothetical protein
MSDEVSHHVSDPAASVQLFYGNSHTPIARIVPSAEYPSLWQVRWPDGRLSGWASLTRCKDAAVAISERGPPPRNPQRLHWRQDRSESPSGGRTRVLLPAPTSTAASH